MSDNVPARVAGSMQHTTTSTKCDTIETPIRHTTKDTSLCGDMAGPAVGVADCLVARPLVGLRHRPRELEVGVMCLPTINATAAVAAVAVSNANGQYTRLGYVVGPHRPVRV